MALSYSVDKIDSTGKELLTYGTPDFPIAFFDDDLTRVRVPWHWHNELELIIITEGTVHVQIANSEFVLKKGEGYFANTGILHAADLLSKKGHQHAMVFDPGVLARQGDLVWSSNVAPILGNHELSFIRLTQDIPWQKNILQFAEDAWFAGAHESREYPITVRYALSKAFCIMTEHRDLLISESIYTDKAKRDELRIKKALTFIENNYATTLTIEQIAESAGISVSSCLRLFKSVLHTTPVQYLIRYRLQMAAEALSQQTVRSGSISDIAYACGFSDAVYFNRCFRKEYHCTPTEFMTKIIK